MNVIYCEKPGISEAWCFVLGVPAIFDVSDSALIRRLASRAVGPLEPRPAYVTAQTPEGAPVAPFWTDQVAFDQGAHLARFGHRYLSVHFLAGESRSYDSYDRSLRPVVRQWLGAFADFVDLGDGEARIEQLGFGYTNTFSFPAEDFDVSRYFHVNFAVALPGHDDLDLGGVETDFRFLDPSVDAVLNVQLKIDARFEEEAEVVVRTRVTCEMNTEGLGFGQTPEVDAAVVRAKNIAKNCFFALATPALHERMGVHYDAVD